MIRMMIERAHLSIISALARHGTLTRAAEELFLTQSALSHTIRKLEEEVGVALWKRRGRRLELTQAGRYLLKVADGVLPLLEQTEHTLAEYGRGRRGTLRIGMECHPCYEWLLDRVAEYLRMWPDVDIDVTQRFQFNGVEALENNRIDVTVTPDPVFREGLHYRSVLNFELLLVVGNHHRLASRSTVTPDDLASELLFTYPVARERLDVFARFLLPASIEPAGHREVEATEIMLQLVAAGRGVTTLPAYMVDKYSAAHNVVGIRLGEEGIFNTLYLGCREEDLEVDYIAAFADG